MFAANWNGSVYLKYNFVRVLKVTGILTQAHSPDFCGRGRFLAAILHFVDLKTFIHCLLVKVIKNHLSYDYLILFAESPWHVHLFEEHWMASSVLDVSLPIKRSFMISDLIYP